MIAQTSMVTRSILTFIKLLVISLTLLYTTSSLAQFSLYDTLPYQSKKLKNLSIIAASTYTVSMVGLNEVWYKDYPRESFHFFNDNAEWKQVDKVGHFYSAFYISAASAKALNRCGIQSKKSAWIGSLVGFTSLLTIEVFDGYSTAYGASVGDLVANASGSSFYWLQQHWWNAVRIQPKFSFQRTSYASQRPNVLGDTFATELLKDYNGQTYWLSVHMDAFMRFPAWLNIAVGYGTDDMIYARDAANSEAGFTPTRQYYLSFDVDLTSIRTRSKFLKAVFTTLSCIKFPAPAFSFSTKGTKFHPLYF